MKTLIAIENSAQVSTSFGDHEPSQSQKRQKRWKKRTMPTKNDMILWRLTDEYDTWENGLTKGKDKLYKCEVAQSVEIIMKYAKSKPFPESDNDYPPHLLAQCHQGWELFPAQDQFLRQHPECSNQCKQNG